MQEKLFKYVLSVDFEACDGAVYFPIEENDDGESEAEIKRMFTELLFASYPPPKVEVLGLSEEEWKAAVKNGKDRA